MARGNRNPKTEAWKQAMADLHARSHKKFERSRKRNAATMGRSNAKTYPGFISPEGDIYLEVQNLSEFCRYWGLTQSSMSQVAAGKLKQHKGWRRVEPAEEPATEGETDEAGETSAAS